MGRSKSFGLPECDREALMKRVWLSVILCSVVVVFAGCTPSREAKEIKWDRDIGEWGQMVISDPRFAAQLVDERGKAHFFASSAGLILWMEKIRNIARGRFG